ncbi:MAG TPA: hypothetical protein VGK20_09440 [Candidatus Binatia bacterium]
MAESDSSTGIVAVLVIFVIVVMIGFVAVRSGVFAGRGAEVKVTTQSSSPAPAQPPAAPHNP